MEGILGATVVNQQKEQVQVASFSGKGKIVAIYFSAHWCPPCRGFTPQLAEFYKSVKASGNADKLEIVFVSSDRDQASFDGYFGEMPWLALPFSDREKKEELANKFGIRGIPTLLIFNAEDGTLLDQNGRGKVSGDPKGEEFPWGLL